MNLHQTGRQKTQVVELLEQRQTFSEDCVFGCGHWKLGWMEGWIERERERVGEHCTALTATQDADPTVLSMI